MRLYQGVKQHLKKKMSHKNSGKNRSLKKKQKKEEAIGCLSNFISCLCLFLYGPGSRAYRLLLEHRHRLRPKITHWLEALGAMSRGQTFKLTDLYLKKEKRKEKRLKMWGGWVGGGTNLTSDAIV